MNTQDTFILRLDFYPQVKMLNREQRGDLLTAIFAYSAGEELPEMDQVTQICFGFIKTSLDANAERYQARCAKNRESGSRGGRPVKKANGFQNNRTVSEKSERLSEKANGFSENPIDLDSDSDSDLDSDSESLSLRDGGASAREREKFYRIFFLKNFRSPRAEVERFIAHYQATGWIRKGQKVVDREALARSWTEQTGTGSPPFPPQFMECWAEIYDALHAETDCGPMFDDLESVQITPDRRIVITTRSPQGGLREFVEAHIGVVKSALEKSYPYHNVHYRIPRKKEA